MGSDDVKQGRALGGGLDGMTTAWIVGELLLWAAILLPFLLLG